MNTGKLFVGLVLLLIGSQLAVSKSLILSEYLSLPLYVVGILVALGTILPEVVFSIRSVMLGYESMAFGNALGSIVVNLFLVLGIISFLKPVIIQNFSQVFFGLTLTVGLVALTRIIAATKGYISSSTGVVLLILGTLFMLTQAALY